MTPELQILMWWLLFGAIHVLGSSVPVRTALIDKIGLRGFKGLYSLVSFATFIPLVYVFFTNKGAGAMLFRPSAAMMHVTEIFMVLAFIVFAQAAATPNPMTTAAEMSDTFSRRPSGIQRVTRHPGNMAFTLFAIGHMFSNAYVGDWEFFSTLLVVGIALAGVLWYLHPVIFGGFGAA